MRGGARTHEAEQVLAGVRLALRGGLGHLALLLLDELARDALDDLLAFRDEAGGLVGLHEGAVSRWAGARTMTHTMYFSIQGK